MPTHYFILVKTGFRPTIPVNIYTNTLMVRFHERERVELKRSGRGRIHMALLLVQLNEAREAWHQGYEVSSCEN